MIETQKTDTYLSTLHNHLSPMTLGERDEIIREISAHIRDSAESGVNLETVLSRLGPAEQLAAKYRDVLLIRQASQSISPVQLLRGAQRLATKGISGILVFVAGMFGYIIGGGLVLTGLMKPVFPDHTGVVVSKWARDRLWNDIPLTSGP